MVAVKHVAAEPVGPARGLVGLVNKAGDTIMRRQFMGLGVVLLALGSLVAQEAAELFGKLDANKDGYVGRDEVQESQTALFERLVRTSDKNGDGKLSKEEFQAGLRPDDAPRPPLGGAQGLPGRAGGPRQAAQANNARPNQGMFERAQLEALFDRTDSNSDGKVTKDEIPEERQGMRGILERAGGESISKEQFVRGMLAMAQAIGQPPRPDGAPPRRPDGQPGGPPGGPPGGGLFGALDADLNGEISNAEIIGAGTALLKLDRNGDGKLTRDEVFGAGPAGGPPGRPGAPPAARPGEGRPGQRGLGGMNPEEFQRRLKEADTNGDGKVSKEEAPPFLRERFERIDANSDGFIDSDESRRMLERMRDAGEKAPTRRPGSDKQ